MKHLVHIALAASVMTLAASQAAMAEERILPVPSVTIYPGDTINESMLKDRVFPENYRYRTAVIESPRVLAGKMARRTLLPGEPIPMNAVDDPKLVTRGTQTQIVFEEGGLSIMGIGIPLQSGTLGETIQVKNVDSGRIITGRVQPDGRVRIGF
ncbi:flagellar basal body P-ring formation chaperone FlgA [Microvirga lotononidis]|uniref:Flagella basal body P-ring formation protein FlgA n=1 Tax=Microvirga lotononidis TaxID=864069 RepID=I4YLU5_9HYPH|nr:flagellar basal body P-ring formation chaperone FlgA [Microvirga lotononidis]EIM24937.1 flagella basal body P-ring formation protein FlgA [Microvirga lotononidis]WQO29563.1 flagellar basal body P-ring formation chaperone FlgA [Microvirga lotononidis]